MFLWELSCSVGFLANKISTMVICQSVGGIAEKFFRSQSGSSLCGYISGYCSLLHVYVWQYQYHSIAVNTSGLCKTLPYFVDYLVSVVSLVFPRSSALAGPIWCCFSGYGIFWSCSSDWFVSKRDFFSEVFSSLLLITSSRKLTTAFFWMESLSKTTLIVFRVCANNIAETVTLCIKSRIYFGRVLHRF